MVIWIVFDTVLSPHGGATMARFLCVLLIFMPVWYIANGMREWRELINAEIQLSASYFFYRQQKMAWNKF